MSRNGNQVTELGIRQKQIEEMKKEQNQIGFTKGKGFFISNALK